MKQIQFLQAKAGLNYIGPITEPTVIVSTAGSQAGSHPWDAVIIPKHPNYPAIEADASLVVIGCRIQGGRFGIKGLGDASIVVHNCNISHNRMSGIYCEGPLDIRQSLIERNGANQQLDHGVYPMGETTISNSILWDNACDQVAHGDQDTTLSLRRCLLGGSRRSISVRHPNNLFEMDHCTWEGDIYAGDGSTYTPDDSNLELLDDDWHGNWKGKWLANPCHRVLWPVAENTGRGCYDYDPRIEQLNITPYRYATKLWYHGDMYAINDMWKKHDHPWPHWPGDEIPGLTEFLAGMKKTEKET